MTGAARGPRTWPGRRSGFPRRGSVGDAVASATDLGSWMAAGGALDDDLPSRPGEGAEVKIDMAFVARRGREDTLERPVSGPSLRVGRRHGTALVGADLLLGHCSRGEGQYDDGFGIRPL